MWEYKIFPGIYAEYYYHYMQQNLFVHVYNCQLPMKLRNWTKVFISLSFDEWTCLRKPLISQKRFQKCSYMFWQNSQLKMY